MIENGYYLQRLKEDFSRRQRANQAYSLRAFARDLDLHPSTLSQVLHEKRPLPLKFVSKVSDKLRLNAKERTLFAESVGRRQVKLDRIEISPEDDRYILDETYFQIIAEWEHYAVLTLLDGDSGPLQPSKIAKKLAITPLRAQIVVDNLLRYGLLVRTRKGLSKRHPHVRTTEDVASSALRASHLETLELGKIKLEKVPVELRDFSSMMIATDPEKIPEMKAIIREFRRKVSKLLKTGDRRHVYQLGIQFYPLTEVGKEE